MEKPMAKRRVITISRETEALLLQELYKKIVEDGYKPDHVVAISSGGLTIGRRLKNLFGVPLSVMGAVSYSKDRERADEIEFARHMFYPTDGISGNVLLVDDLTDTGRTLELGVRYLREKFNEIDDVHTAIIWHKSASKFAPDHFAEEIVVDPKLDPDGLVPWIEQPDEVEESFPRDGEYYVEE